MVEKKEKTREEIISDWVTQEKKAQRAGRKSKRNLDEEVGVTINSLMDAMTIILVFLLMNYSIDPLRVDSSEDLKLPPSITDISPKASAAVTVTKKHLVVGDKEIVKLEADGSVSKDDKEDLDEKKLKIEPLFRALTDEANRQKEMARLRGAKFDGVMTVIATETTNYRLLFEILYTAGQAEFSKFKFAVLKGGRRGGK
jgi:biopolymer transport protein ExbD